MKQTGLRLLTTVLLLVHLIAPTQAILASVGSVAGVTSSHYMQQMDHQSDSQMQSGNDCCQHDKVCHEANCKQCQSCAVVAMLVNLHHQTIVPPFAAISLVHITEYLQGISAPNLYRPPITTL